MWKLQETSPTFCVNLLKGRNAQKRPCSGIIFGALLLGDCRDALGLRWMLVLFWLTGLEKQSWPKSHSYWGDCKKQILRRSSEKLWRAEHSFCFYFHNDASRSIWGISCLGWRGWVINRQTVRVYNELPAYLNVKPFTIFGVGTLPYKPSLWSWDPISLLRVTMTKLSSVLPLLPSSGCVWSSLLHFWLMFS